MKKNDKKQEEKQIIQLPEMLKARLNRRREQILRHKERTRYLQMLNEEALTAFLEGKGIDPEAELTLDEQNWEIAISKKAVSKTIEKQ